MPKDTFPRAPVNESKQDDSNMVYVNGGEFDRTGIGARKSGQPKGSFKPGSLEHVGGSASGSK